MKQQSVNFLQCVLCVRLGSTRTSSLTPLQISLFFFFPPPALLEEPWSRRFLEKEPSVSTSISLSTVEQVSAESPASGPVLRALDRCSSAPTWLRTNIPTSGSEQRCQSGCWEPIDGSSDWCRWTRWSSSGLDRPPPQKHQEQLLRRGWAQPTSAGIRISSHTNLEHTIIIKSLSL